jgi:hypothetical protein
VTQRTTKAAHTPIIDHIIMVCGFKHDSVIVECINQKEWTTLNDVVSIGINEPNTFHTVKADGITFKARSLSKDIRMLKGFITFYNRMTHEKKRLLGEDDVMNTFTAMDFRHYCRTMDYHTDMAAAGSVSIPSFESLIADGVFHVESELRALVVVPTTLTPDTEEEQEVADIELDMTSNDKSTTETVFVKSWDHMSDDTEEYEVVFEVKDVTSKYLPCELSADCSNVDKEALQLEPDVYVQSIRLCGAKDNVMYHGFNTSQWGAIKQEALSGIETGEQMFVAYIQRMLIVVLDSARVYDPGGQYNTIGMVNQNILVQQ